MHRAGFTGSRRPPRHIALDRKIDLERPRAVAEPPVGTRNSTRQPVAQDVGRDQRRHVEQQQIGRRQLVSRADPNPGLHPPAVCRQVSHERVRNRLGTALGHHPAVLMARGQNHHPDGAGHRAVQAPERVRSNACPQCPSLLAAPVAAHHGGGRRRHRPEPGSQQRMAWHPQQRLRDVFEQRIEIGRQRSEEPTPPSTVTAQPRCGLIDGLVQHAGRAVVERMRAIDDRRAPPQTERLQIEPAQKRRRSRHRMHSGTLVVHQARHDGLGAARASPDGVRRLQHRHVHAGSGQVDRSGQSIRPAADDRRRRVSRRAGR